MDPFKSREDLSARVETKPVSVAKNLDVKEVTDFVYVRCNIPGPGTPRSQFEGEFEGCECQQKTCDSNCACIDRFGQAYDVNGRLIRVDPYSSSMKPIYECNSSCKCSQACPNRVVQSGIRHALEVFRTKSKGYGLQTTGNIAKNDFVCEYAGEVISYEVAKQRTQRLDKDQANYILTLREHGVNGEVRTHVDPTYIGNCGRFINHSCEPNLYMVPVRVSCDVPRLALFALRDIAEGEELTYTYSGDIREPGPNRSPGREQGEGKDKDKGQSKGQDKGQEQAPPRTPCLCGSKNCTGTLPFDESLFTSD